MALPIHVVVDRFISDENSTLGRVFIFDNPPEKGKKTVIPKDAVPFVYSIEDEFREKKVAGETRIPAGIYELGLHKVGRFNAKYGSRFNFHIGMILVKNVPNFEGILIHIGNTEKDTEGCLCVGLTRNAEKLMVMQSQIGYEKFYKKIINAVAAGKATIEYQDNDGKGVKKNASSPA